MPGANIELHTHGGAAIAACEDGRDGLCLRDRLKVPVGPVAELAAEVVEIDGPGMSGVERLDRTAVARDELRSAVDDTRCGREDRVAIGAGQCRDAGMGNIRIGHHRDRATPCEESYQFVTALLQQLA